MPNLGYFNSISCEEINTFAPVLKAVVYSDIWVVKNRFLKTDFLFYNPKG